MKAQLLRKYFEPKGIEVLSPSLKHDPKHALQTLQEIVQSYQDGELAIVGSSLGAFYACYLVQQLPETKVVLINPATSPWEVFKIYSGDFENPDTGEQFTITEQKANELQQYAVETIHKPGRFLLLLQQDDELLDYQVAVESFPDSQVNIYTGGGHTFTNFENVLTEVAQFIGID